MIALNSLLDEVRDALLRNAGAPTIAALCDSLREVSRTCTRDEWTTEIAPACRRHPLHELLLQDPYTWRAFHKPRGYAGDAEMLDYVYRCAPPEHTTPIGRQVFRATTGLPNGQSVRYRKDLLATRIDEAALAFAMPRILAVACGHLREAQQARSVRGDKVGEIVALDQDAQSLSVVAREQGDGRVQTVNASVAALLRDRKSFGNFHLVYAAGLFDYLTDGFAKRLLRVMFDMLRPGGRVLIANFTPDNCGRAYMECFMDWHLLCRTESDMSALAEEVRESRATDESIWRDPFGNVVYLELVKSV